MGAEYLGVDAGARDTPGFQIGGKAAKESIRSAEIKVRFLRYLNLLQRRKIQASRDVVIHALPIAIFRLAIGDEYVAVRKVVEQRARFGCKWVLRAIASAVAPPDFSRGIGAGSPK